MTGNSYGWAVWMQSSSLLPASSVAWTPIPKITFIVAANQMAGLRTRRFTSSSKAVFGKELLVPADTLLLKRYFLLFWHWHDEIDGAALVAILYELTLIRVT